MDALINYALPISGMGDGLHQFDFQIGDAFFAAFENSAIKESNLQVRLDFDKLPSFFVLDFHIEGTVKQECDRCLEPFDLPLEADYSLKVKFDEEEREEAEVVYINRERKQLNVARYIYEFIHLAIPISKTHDMADEDCNPEFLKFLDGSTEETSGEETDEANPSVWDELKKLKDQ